MRFRSLDASICHLKGAFIGPCAFESLALEASAALEYVEPQSSTTSVFS